MKRGWVLTLAALAACQGKAGPELAGDLSGFALPEATARPAFSLTTLAGDSFDFRARTAGRLTLLFFGYTNCPDVCPATMANIGAVTNRLPSAERREFDVIFVTTDPDRDTPERLGPWLAKFDREIIGLTGSAAQLEAAQRAAGITVAFRDDSTGNYNVFHAAQVLVYSPDDSAHVMYPFGTRQAEWGADLPKLLTRWSGR
ncbi:MAG: SCO family protein [Gemmatimonadales bacterium]|nr:SCO family protein [Gemmatimonadales bacterium]